VNAPDSLFGPSRLQTLACGRCGEEHDPHRLQTVCIACGGPLLARYDLESPGLPDLAGWRARPRIPFRLPELLPLRAGAETPSLGEGNTPLVEFPRVAAELGAGRFLVKDESRNPGHAFKARGMAVAVARAAELGARTVALPTAGNAGVAAAAYGARHGLAVQVALPRETPAPIRTACRALGARVQEVEGSIAEAGAWIAERAEREGWFVLATLREPYRLEGKKLMGYELLDELGRLPEVILYPTGGGTGLIGMARAFDEMEALGWTGPERPRFVAVQTEGCAPLVRAFEEGLDHAPPWEDPAPTRAFGLRVPAALGDFLMLDILRRGGGTARAVPEAALTEAGEDFARRFGMWLGPEAAACLAAARQLAGEGWFRPADTVVLFQTGSPFVYLG